MLIKRITYQLCTFFLKRYLWKTDLKVGKVVLVKHTKEALYLLYNHKLLGMVRRLLINLFLKMFPSFMFTHLTD